MNYVITTTINKPTFIEEYIKDFGAHDHNYLFVIAGDLKTPPGVADYCRQFDKVVYLDVRAQQRQFSGLPLTRFVPFNSIDRRNFAYLYCLKQGIKQEDVLITLDDDNLLKEEDFLGKHGQGVLEGEVISAERYSWYNALEMFYEENMFMRGFSPFDRKANKDREVLSEAKKIRIAMNQGLWEENPDVDAIERIKGLSGKYQVKKRDKLVLGENVVCPLDTQNTAYLNGFWLTAFLCPFVGRFDDIFSSYVSKRIADHFGYGVSYGAPVVYQERNPHDNYQDFLLELQGMALVDTFTSWLWSLDLKAESIREAYAELAGEMRESFVVRPLHTKLKDNRTELWDVRQMGLGAELWLASLDKLNVSDVVPREEAQVAYAA